jgi:Mn-containing catalase
MYMFDNRLQYPVRVEKPDPVFARALQQAIGGVEGEIRVCLQYFFQAWGQRGPDKYRELLLNTATEEIGHIEMLATAVALNLEGASLSEKEDAAKDPMGGAVLNGVNFKNILSSGLAAMPIDSDGVPFDASHVYASGNIAADMTANLAAESTGRVLAVRLYNMTSDPGMKDMLNFLITRDTMHQNQWFAILQDLGGLETQLPIPNSYPQENELQDFNYTFVGTRADGTPPPESRATSGPSPDGKGQFRTAPIEALGEKPQLAPPRPKSGAQKEQIQNDPDIIHRGINAVKDALS